MAGATFLHGDRVELRTIEEDDLEFFRDTVNDPSIRRPLATTEPYNMDAEREWYESLNEGDDSVELAVAVDGEPAGVVGLHGISGTHGTAEIGYWLAPEYHGEGYGSDAAATLTTYGFAERRLRTVKARVFEFNEASQALLASIGYEQVGQLPDWVFVDGEHRDVLLYAVTADQWER